MRNGKIFLLMILIISICTGCGEHSGTYKNLTHEEATEIMSSNADAIILDVRTPEEYEKKHIPKSILIPIEDLRKGDFSKIPDKNATILIYCWTGRRAEDASQLLADKGYKNIYTFGGLVDWTGDVEGTEITARSYKKISQEEAWALATADPPKAILLDARFPKDYEARHIPGAINFPLEVAVAENFDKIPDKNAMLITYCGDGNRGGLTAKVLVQSGYTNVYTMGGIIDWKGPVEGTDVNPEQEADK